MKKMLDINQLKFDEKGLIPAVVVDAITKQVLTVAVKLDDSIAEMKNKLSVGIVTVGVIA